MIRKEIFLVGGGYVGLEVAKGLDEFAEFTPTELREYLA